MFAAMVTVSVRLLALMLEQDGTGSGDVDMMEVVTAGDGGTLEANCWGKGVQLAVNAEWTNPTGDGRFRLPGDHANVHAQEVMYMKIFAIF